MYRVSFACLSWAIATSDDSSQSAYLHEHQRADLRPSVAPRNAASSLGLASLLLASRPALQSTDRSHIHQGRLRMHAHMQESAFQEKLNLVEEWSRDALGAGSSLGQDSNGQPVVLERNLVDIMERTVRDGVDVSPDDVISVQTAVLDSFGHDLLVFLVAAAITTPISNALKLSPILLYLVFGALLGPNGLDMFQSSEGDILLGDFGILFLLYSEGLEVTAERFKQLANYLPLGLAQISLTTAALSAAILGGGAMLSEMLPVPAASSIDITNWREVLVLSVVGTLSTSAFVFPVLQQKGWEGFESGKAATSILLLQDLFVAPLLVVLPFIVGQGLSSGAETTAVLLLAGKAMLGFGAAVFAGSYTIQNLFKIVTQARSADTFVALTLLVAVGMGVVAKSFGLTDTVGAFIAGVLLANSNFRFQISAVVAPFKGILLGCFFLTAGSQFDPGVLVSNGPLVAMGVASLILIKGFALAVTLAVDSKLPTVSNVSLADAIRLSVLLAGGGEFAFVVLATAQKLGLTSGGLNGILTTIVLLSMAVTPLLGDAAENLSAMASGDESQSAPPTSVRKMAAPDAIVMCGYGEVGSSITEVIGSMVEDALCTCEGCDTSDSSDSRQKEPTALPSIVCFDLNPSRLPRDIQNTDVLVVYGDGANEELVRSTGVKSPRAIVVTYSQPERRLAAVQRLRLSFPDAPIYARAESAEERDELVAYGASAAVTERQELVVQLGACLYLDEKSFQLPQADESEDLSVREKAAPAVRCVVESLQKSK